jgi:L-rhamnose mutarotase
MTEHMAFVMKLKPGMDAEYRRRHAEVWPELLDLLRAHGISNYTIHLHAPSSLLFAEMDVDDPARLDDLSRETLMRRWWEHMADIMETDKDRRPVQEPLISMFWLP